MNFADSGYKELCWENGAMTRHRGIQNEEELLMLVLFYALGHSLIEVKNYAKIEFNRNIGSVPKRVNREKSCQRRKH